MRAVDLEAFGKKLPPKHRRLRGLLERMRDLHSAHSDLKLAADFSARVVDVDKYGDRMPLEFLEDAGLALLYASIVFYARATKSKSRHRKGIDLRASFDASELIDHKFICELRDDAVAHYGPGVLSGNVTLREDRMFLPEDDQKLLYTTRNLAGSASLAKRIRGQAQRALIITQRLFEEHQSDLVSALNKAIEEDPEILKLSREAEVDFEEALGDSHMAANILGGPRVGSRRVSGQLAATRAAKSSTKPPSTRT